MRGGGGRNSAGGGGDKPRYSIRQKRGVPTKADADLTDEVQVRAQVTLPSGASVVVAHGDITNERVDCLVNAANSQLKHGAGLAKAIRLKGGPCINAESQQWLSRHGLVETAHHAVTSGGGLPCKLVLHVVGPLWEGGRNQERELLQASLRNALRTCADRGMASLATPALSSGLFKFPKDLCAQILIDTAHDFLEGSRSSVREVRFTNFDSETTGYFERYFAQKYGGAGGGPAAADGAAATGAGGGPAAADSAAAPAPSAAEGSPPASDGAADGAAGAAAAAAGAPEGGGADGCSGGDEAD
eukprot:TRINITY_DN65524_c0_g1_i1.p1 TRINITY_DN65524_c0_g1~~TRINITY_DN65524_c0_g1_i1.p1  ORF type:complete len:333 (+),score=78.29 TRINITY_DN65524_c0_g1_i1:97-999(+)